MRKLLVTFATLVGLVAPVAWIGAADADVTGFGSDLRNRQIKHFSILYKRVCPSCKNGEQPGVNIPTASAKAKFTLATYKILDQNHKFDFYAVDTSAQLVKRRGDQDWGWMDVTVRSTGSTRIVASSYSLGKGVQNVKTCHSFPIDLGVEFKGVSAGTTVGHISFCHEGSKITQKRVSRGRFYHSTGLTGISRIDGQRYVQVPQGAHPTFAVKVTTNNDSLQCPTLSDGTHCFVGHGMHSKHRKIGTTPQR